ncbi:NYN domain-containing protein [Methylomonas koyamae]|uniref:Uncharacterized protein n=1 Tax=Methylomonas koyamae TaxID=702114 RepID=A0A291IKN9_9GAMM|nr:NYN domain-containing protein [Methylomonas koyamae]ATG90771.1 hypothetical protein MKLM6_2551 [Methylomonas koyamae]OAI22167.1 hypothetical protein A1356_01860 [Methylomonas koyamae]
MIDSNRIAVFIDAENVGSWIKQGGVEILISELKALGQIIIRRAYGVWSRPHLAMYQATLNKQGFELIHCYHPASGKNSADIYMTVDVMECAWQFNNINYFVLVTGDSDFSPVFRRLRAIGKEVIGVGQSSTLSQCVEGTCSRYIYTDEFVECSQNLPEINASIEGLPQANVPCKTQKSSDQDVIKQKILSVAIELTKTVLKSEKGPINISQLRNKLVARDKAFDHKVLGFSQFSAFLAAINGIKLEKKGTAQFASLVNKAEKDKPASTIEKIDLAEKYKDLLHKKGVFLVDVEKLKLIYSLSCKANSAFSDISVEEFMAELSVQKMKINKDDIRNAIDLFRRANLTINKNGNIALKKLSTQEFLSAIDVMLIAELIEIKKSIALELKAKEIKKLSFSTISKDEIKNIIKVG